MEIIELTKKLISIPSYVDKNTNEGKIGEFIYQYLKKFSWLDVEKQYVTKDRFNIIASDRYPTRLTLCDHIDTVQIQSGWKSDPFNPIEKDGKIFGLGASDTKGNVASLLCSIEEAGPTKGLMVLLYVDEEYDFWGMKKFIEKYKDKVKPKIIGSADGGNLELGNACRGLVEINFKVKGKAGHAAIPESGSNAILGSFAAIEKIKTKIAGKNTLNIAWIRGGQKLMGYKKLGKEGNIIPDYCEFVLELRIADPNLNAKKVIKMMDMELKKQDLDLISYFIRHDYGAWITKKEELNLETKIAKTKKFTKPEKRGYIDLQMLWEAFGKPVCFTFGAGEPNVCHKANEYIKIDKLEKGKKFWIDLIKAVCSKN
jgi:acetylornithine deacetylase/succinyl-diaminopimelate desuccinylase-like protein